jgi:integrase
MTTRARYQNGSLSREKRTHGPDVWVLRWREATPAGRTKRKEIVGTVEQLKTKASAMKACEALRININKETRVPRTFGELVTHYKDHELPKNKTPYTIEVYKGYLVTWILPEWKEHRLSDIHAVAGESWLDNLPLALGTRAKLRNLMHAIYNHGMRCRFTSENPITLVRQSAKRGRIPNVLTVEELKGLLLELKDPWRTAVFVAVTTGLRVSELLALKWQDCDFASGQLNLCRGIVRQHVGEMKSEASRKPLPLDAGLAKVLLAWRSICPFNQDSDYIFGSLDKNGQQPYWPTAGMEDHVRPAVKRAGITKRIGWHTLRHTFGTLVKSQGADVTTTKELMRHANISITMDRYVQAVTEQKKQAQRSVVSLLAPNGPTMLELRTANC